MFLSFSTLIFLFFCLEVAVRSYSLIVNKASFFRTNTFVSPWITTLDYPWPITKADGKAYFRHRGFSTSTEKPVDTIRIIAVGGSTTANDRSYRINQIDYPKALEVKLADGFKGLSFEVLNAGGSAYSTAQSLINIEFRLVEFNPDMIILMHNINDSSVNAYRDGVTSDYANKYIQPYYLNPSLQGSLSFAGFLMQSRLLSAIGLPKLLANKSRDFQVVDEYDYGLKLFKRNLAAIACICKLHDIDLVLLSQPYTLEPIQKIGKEVFMAYDKGISDVAREQGVFFIDMFLKFGHEKRFFLDHFHYSPEGIERFSNILYSELGSIISRRIKHNNAINTDS